MKVNFPNHLLSMIFCIALAVMFALLLTDGLKHKGTVLAALVCAAVLTLAVTKPATSYVITLPAGEWECSVDDTSVVEVDKDAPDTFTVRTVRAGGTYVTFTNEKGETEEYYVTVSAGGIYVNRF